MSKIQNNEVRPQLKLAKVDNEIKLVEVKEFDSNMNGYPMDRLPIIKRAFHEGIIDLRTVIECRMHHCEQSLIDACNRQQIISEDDYAFYYKENGHVSHFSKRAYKKMQDLYQLLIKDEYVDLDILLNDVLMCDQLLKAIVFEQTEFVFGGYKRLLILALIENIEVLSSGGVWSSTESK